jgi:putative ABC transport system permease protein
MRSTLLTKSVTDLTRRKARAVFAVLTLAIAVASIGIFAAPSLMDAAMQEEVRASRLADVTLQTKPLMVTSAQLGELARLPNVEGVQALSVVQTRVWIGERRQKAIVVGVPDYARQPVSRVAVTSGVPPQQGTVLTDVQNADGGRYDGGVGDTLRVVGVGDRVHEVRVSGVGRNLEWSQLGVNGDFVVLYATPETASLLAGEPGYSLLAFRLRDASTTAANGTVNDVRSYLRANTSFTRFSDLPTIREPGSYPGKELFEQLASLMNVFTVIALIAAGVLVANTMGTLIGEQRREIGMMKAIGGTRRQIRRVYLRTALLLGAIGAVLGAGLGIVIANLIVGFFGSSFFAISPSWSVSVPVVVASVVLGLIGPPLTALPAIRRGTRTPVREGLEEVPPLHGGVRIVDRFLRRLGFLPRTAQIGVRSVTRRTRRTVATVAQIALAVGTLLGVLALMNSVTTTTEAAWNQLHYDLDLNTVVGKQLDADAEQLIRGTPGVATAQPVLMNMVKAAGKDAFAWGLPPQPMFDRKVLAGRWFTAAEEATAAPVTVIAENIARELGAEVGDRVQIGTASGPRTLRVVGMTGTQMQNGLLFLAPLSTMRAILNSPDTVNAYWVRTARPHDHRLIDRTTTALEDRLAAAGYSIGTNIRYVDQARNVDTNRQISMAIGVLGFLIVAISMVGLVNAITMSVLERTREIGVLRCIGARARDIRRIFGAEGLTVSLAGWLLGIPVGYVLARVLNWLLVEVVKIEFTFTFPLVNLAIALVGTLVLALVIIRIPLRRAVRFKPGEALRYA